MHPARKHHTLRAGFLFSAAKRVAGNQSHTERLGDRGSLVGMTALGSNQIRVSTIENMSSTKAKR
jgi:hypothetical protein